MGEDWRKNFAPGAQHPCSREWFIYEAHRKVDSLIPRPNTKYFDGGPRPAKEPRIVDTRFPPVPERFPPDPQRLFPPCKTK
eukprot:4021390-Alexandrium_andersonii.AAC.1